MKTFLQKTILQLFFLTGLIISIHCNESLAQTISTLNGSTALNTGNAPYGVVVDAAGNVYIAFYGGGAILKITPAGVRTTFATIGGAVGLAVDPTFPASGSLYVSSYDDNVLYKVSTAGVVTPFCNTLLDGPEAIARDASGNIYVWDYNDARIYKVNTSGVPTLFAGTGVGGNSGDNGSALSATFGGGGEGEIAVDANNNVYIADQANNRVRIIAGVTGGGKTVGNVYAFAGTGATGSTGDGAAATSAKFSVVGGIRLDAAGNVYISDRSNHTIRKVDLSGIITRYAGTVGSPGSAGDGGLATAATLSNPYGLGIDGSDNLYILDFGNAKVRKITAGAAAPCWATMTYSVSSNPIISSPYLCAAADYNKDGKMDIAVSNFTNGQITVFMGNGNGTFGTGTVIPVTGTGERGVVSADFNSDGNADLAVVNTGTNNVSILFGNGNGTFGASVQYATGSAPYTLTAADVNADGKIDLAVANAGTNTLTVLKNNGSGVFTTSATPTVGTAPQSVTIADFNGDGKVDLACCNQTSNDISFVVGNGDGTFGAVTTVATGLSQPWQIANADFDGDGKLDLVVNNRNASTIGVYKGNGSGGFTAFAGSPIAGFNNALYVVTGDFNVDGKADIIVGNYGGASVSVALGNGAGGFTVATSPAAGSNPWSVTVADFNGDSKLDIIAMNASNTTVLLNTSSIVSASATSPVCTSGTLTLTGGPASMTSYAWSGPNGFTSSLQSPTISTPTTAAAGVYALTVTTSGPCTATASATVVVNTAPAPVDLGAVTACGSYTIGTIVHTSSGSYTDHLTSVKGCDSAVTVNLTINTIGTRTQTISKCAGQTYTINGHTYNSTGTYVDRLIGASPNGCDSIITTNLTIIYGTGAAAFGGFTDYPAASNIYGIVNADFNGDGKTDIATANFGSNSVTVKLGNGLGGFATSATLTSSQAAGIASADFNGDGKADLAVSNTNGINTISIFLGNGSGGFAAASPATVASVASVWSVVAVDLNGDGKIDLVTGNGNGGNTVSVLMGNGNGTFQAKTDYTMGASSYAAVVADFNNDGKLDIMTPNFGASNVTTLRGNGDGTFNPALLTTTTSANPRFLAVNDFNGDGKPDFAVVYQGFTTMGVFLGNGSGGYGAGTNYTVGTNPVCVTSGDFNGDGKIDLVSSNYDSNNLSLLLGTGSGTFGTATTIPASTNPVILINGDYNGDGKPDLAAGNYGTPNASIWLNTTALVTSSTATVSPNPICTGTMLGLTGPSGLTTYSWAGPNSFTSTLQSTSIPAVTTAAAGVYTLTVSESHGCTGSASTAAVVVNTTPAPVNLGTVSACGSYTIGATTHTSSGVFTDHLTSVKGCDSAVTINLTINTIGTRTQTISKCAGQSVTINGHTYNSTGTYIDRLIGASPNGCDSIITTNLSIYYGAGAASFGSFTNTATGANSYGIANADFNGDGKTDIAIASQGSGSVTVKLGDGLGGFITSATLTSSQAVAVASADFNGDGKADLAVSNTNGINTISIFLGNGSGGFTAAPNVPASSTIWSVVAVDLNNDGKIDLVTGNGSGGNTVSVVLGNGNGTFQAKTDYTMGTSSYAAVVADFNGDGKLDIMTPNFGSSNVTTLRGNGDGTFNPTLLTTTTSANPRFLTVNDFNGDGKLDFGVVYQGFTTMGVFLGNGTGGYGAGTTYTIGNNPVSITSGDFNGDGKIDLVAGNYVDNSLSLLLGTGTGTFGTAATIPASTNPTLVIAGDYNGDGKTDLAAANYGTPNASIWLNTTALVSSASTTASPNPVCTSGTNSTLNLTGPAGLTTYLWSGPNGFTSSLQSPPIANPTSAAAGVYTLKVSESHGCTASASTGAVVVNMAKSSSQSVTTCGSYSVGNNTHSTSGTFVDVIPSAGGCDSTVTTILTIKPLGVFSQTLNICAGNSVTVGSHTYTATGTYSDRLVSASANGCDSIVNTKINIVFGNGGVSFTPQTGPAITNGYLNAVADFNNDGKKDIVVSNGTSGIVTYFKGNGDGTFVAGTSITVTGSAQRGIATADFNGDGNADLAIANFSSNNVSVLFGNGNGTFGASAQYTTGTGPYNLTAADLDGDGKADIVVANSSTNTLTVLKNNGAGVFTTSATPTVGTAPQSITTADFNGDGNIDMACVNQTSNTTSVLLGNGNGTFGTASTITGLNQPWQIANADFNGDGKIDLVTNNRNANTITILKGDGAGGFTNFPGSPFAVGNSPLYVVPTDVNADGKMDILCGNYGGSTISVVLGNGAGGFSIFSSPAVGSSPWSINSADFNGDNKPDVVSVNNSGNSLTVLAGTGTGAFTSVLSSTLTLASPYISTIADFNNDGKNDLIVSNNASGNVSYFKGNGDGTFAAAVSIAVSGSTAQRGIVSADFNSDGKMDFAVANQTATDKIYVVLGNGNGTFGAATGFTVGSGSGPYNLTTGDFNNDSKIDLAVANSGSNTLTVLLNNGAGSFTTSATPTVGSLPNSITTADFNGDGKIDMACVNQTSNTVSVLLGNGNGTFGTATTLPGVTLNQPWEIVNADFDGDGKVDLVTNNRNANTITILKGDGAGGFTNFPGSPFAVGSSPLHVVTTDVNGDGKTDILCGNYGGNTVSVLLGNGAGGFSIFSSPAIGTSPWSVKCGDFNGDNKPDLVACNAANLTVLLNLTPTLVTPPTVSSNSPVCPNNTLNLTSTPAGLSNYSWSGPNFYTGSGQNPTLAGPGTDRAGVYIVTVTDSRGCTGTANTPAVVMKTLPNISINPLSAVCTGSTNVTLTASGSSGGYTWSPITNLTPTAGTSAIETAQISQLTFYTVSGSSSNGCSNTAVVPVATVATGGTISPIFSIICSGGTKLLTVTGAAGHNYQWQISGDNVNWTDITGATNTTYTTNTTDGNTNKYYRLQAQSNTCWNVASTTAEVDVSHSPITITTSALTDNSITLNWTPIGSGNYNISYTGASSGTVLSTTPPKTITGLTANGSYTITLNQTGTGLGSCPATGTVNIKTLCAAPPTVTIVSTGTSSITLSWTGGAGNYRVYFRPLYAYNGYFTKDVINGTSTTLTLQGGTQLYHSVTYEVYVTKLDCPLAGNIGQPSSKVYATTAPALSCAAPVIDSVRSLCPVQIEVWVHGSPTNQYYLDIERLTPTVQPVTSYPVTGSYFTMNVSAGQNYLITARSICGGAVSNMTLWPAPLQIKPQCGTLTNLLLSNPTCDGFTASWNSDQCIANNASYYQLFIRQVGTINWNGYGVTIPTFPIGPYKVVNWLGRGKTFDVFAKAVYSCNGYLTYGATTQTQRITTLSAGCRTEGEQPEAITPLARQTSADNSEVFTLYPNPNNGKFSVDVSRLNMQEDAVRIEVTNILGQTVITQLTSISDGHMSEFINMPVSTAPGTYMVRVTAGKNVYTSKMNISR